MLAAFANPESPDFRKLKLKTETRVLQKALGEFEVEGVNIAWEPLREDITLEGLNKYLLEKPDIFHFSGHGVFKAMDDTGSLVLLKDVDSKKPDFLPAPDLARKLQAAGVRLVMLGACESGRQHGNTPWTAIAPALVAAGIPAVVAMQFEVEDAKAILFSQGFYTTLAAGLSIDEAITNGRLAMLEKSDEKGVEWGVPTMYMRGDGLIFSTIAERETELAGLIRNSVNQIVDEVAKGGELIGMEFKKGARPGHYIVVQKINIVKGKVVGKTFDSL
jgi:CHAT domain-containing protein